MSKTNFVIEISFGDNNTEYWNSSLINDDFVTKNIDNAEGFDTEEEASTILKDIVIPHANNKKWNVSLSIYEF